MSLKDHLAKQAYYFSYESKPVPTFVFHIHPDVIQSLEKEYGLKNYRIIQMKGEKIGVSEFETSFDKGIGFVGGESKNRGIVSTHLELAFCLSHCVKFLEELCEKCEGSGKDDFAKEHLYEDRDCWHCRGTGKKLVDDDSFRRVWHSIEILLRYLSLFSEVSHLQQDIKMHHPVDGRITDRFIEQLAAYFQKKEVAGSTERSIMGPDYAEVEPVVNAMSEAWHYIDLRSDDRDYIERRMRDFIGEVSRHGGFLVQCPGNRTFVALFRQAGDFDKRSPHGHETMNHNIDTVYQHLTLLIGLTVLYHEVLKETLS